MIRDKKNIDALFEEGLKKFKEQPPSYAWDRLDKGLDKAHFKKSLFFLRWMAASVLIILAFGAGYYYAIYNLEAPQITDDINSSMPALQNTELTNSQTDQDKSNNFSENSVDEKSVNEDSYIKNIIIPAEKNTFLAQDNFSSEAKNKIFDTENKETELSVQIIRSDEVSGMDKVDINSIPVSLIAITLEQEVKEPTRIVNTEVAIADPPPMSLYYNPEDYGLVQTKKELETKWALGAQFAPVVSYRDISINYENQQASTIINDDESQLNNTEESLLSYAGGVDVNYHVSKRWSIQSGLYYSRIGQVNNDALNFKQDNDQYLLFSINTSTGDINIAFEKVPDDVKKVNPPKDTLEAFNIGDVKIIQNFDLFEIPFMVKYKVLDKRFGINLSGGLSPAYVVKNNTYLEVDNNKHDIGSSENLKPMVVNTSFSLGLNYGVTKKLTINFEPTFKYSLSPINNNSQFDYHPYYFSWYTGIRYNF